MKDDHGLRTRNRAGQLAQGLAHQAGLKARLAVAHLAVDFRTWRERCDRIDHEHVDRAGADQRIGDLQRLFAGVGLRDQQVFEIDAELLGIDRVERVFGVDEGADAAFLLGFGDDVQRQRGLARRFRSVNLDHATARQTADTERDIEPQRAGRDGLDLQRLLVFAEAHDRAFAEAPLDLRQRSIQRLGLVHGRSFHDAKIG